MHFDGSLGAAELRPIEDRGVQLDGGGVDRQQLVLEAELVADASSIQLHRQKLSWTRVIKSDHAGIGAPRKEMACKTTQSR
jgi:hypothetical protein